MAGQQSLSSLAMSQVEARPAAYQWMQVAASFQSKYFQEKVTNIPYKQ
nr:hypothetical protein AZ54_17155 [Xanthomonas oryzae pv. oryzae PXO86]